MCASRVRPAERGTANAEASDAAQVDSVLDGSRRSFASWSGRVILVVAIAGGIQPLRAQEPPAPPHEHPVPAPAPAQDGHQHEPIAPAHEHAAAASTLFEPRSASGTAWQPETSPMYGIHQHAGAWELMWHGNAFAQYLYEKGRRGSDQGGSINWVMGMARRNVAGGRVGVRGMLSLEPWSIPGCGYPDLLATGETCRGEAIHDRQHPHDLFMELAAEFDRPVNGALRWHAYAGLAGEPALGPVAYPHRGPALANPLAPISHHWLDATHITFGVVTAGLSGSRWKAEASAFNGREPDEHRSDLDLAPLDSFSGRFWYAPADTLTIQISAGHLVDAEAGHAGDPRADVDRITASATYYRGADAGPRWAATAAWGRNAEGEAASHALLLESSLSRGDRDTWFGRFEIVGKRAHDLDVPGTATFTVAKLQAGYTRYFQSWRGLQSGLGGSISAGFVPEGLQPVYGKRVNPGAGLFVTLRPAAHRM